MTTSFAEDTRAAELIAAVNLPARETGTHHDPLPLRRRSGLPVTHVAVMDDRGAKVTVGPFGSRELAKRWAQRHESETVITVTILPLVAPTAFTRYTAGRAGRA